MRLNDIYKKKFADSTTRGFSEPHIIPNHLTMKTLIWEEFLFDIIQSEFVGEDVGIAFLKGGTKFPKPAYRMTQRAWGWNLPALKHMPIRVDELPEHHATLYLYRKGQPCRYFISLNDTKGTKFGLDRDKRPIKPISTIHISGIDRNESK